MQSVSSRIWTRVAESISYDDNHYSTVFYYLVGEKWMHICLNEAEYISRTNGLEIHLYWEYIPILQICAKNWTKTHAYSLIRKLKRA